ncbi:isochorismatase family protein [Rhodoligotrophos defluvii]|jgi:nicotinamidase-related amidase|uniref:isochorismatase family protein n=1 Tax=Rhodoligotrophos defluvii TaxID=2561934 RepID=UPI0014855CA4|nr:isochorismatase family protein [Rhodoligotrophos defluvii]
MVAPSDEPKRPRAETTGKWTTLLTPDTAVIAVIDFQSSQAVRLQSSEAPLLVENAAALVKIAAVFGVPLILSTSRESDDGELIGEVSDAAAQASLTVRATGRRNAWEDPSFRNAILCADRRKLVLAGLFTEEAITLTTIAALEAGFEAYVVLDACGATSADAHHVAIRRLEQAGAIPVTTRQVAREFLDVRNTPEARAAVRAIEEAHFSIGPPESTP